MLTAHSDNAYMLMLSKYNVSHVHHLKLIICMLIFANCTKSTAEAEATYHKKDMNVCTKIHISPCDSCLNISVGVSGAALPLIDVYAKNLISL